MFTGQTTRADIHQLIFIMFRPRDADLVTHETEKYPKLTGNTIRDRKILRLHNLKPLQ